MLHVGDPIGMPGRRGGDLSRSASADVARGDMTLDHIAVDHGGVAGRKAASDAILHFESGEIGQVVASTAKPASRRWSIHLVQQPQVGVL